MVWLRGLDCAAAGHPQSADRLDPAVAGLRNAAGGAGQRGTGGGVGIQRVGLALGPPGLAVWPVDLHHRHPGEAQLPGQRGTVGAGALDADPLQLTMATQPAQQRLVAGRCRGELPIAELTPERIQYPGVVRAPVGVDTARDIKGCHGHAGHRRTSSACIGCGSARSGRAGRTSQ